MKSSYCAWVPQINPEAPGISVFLRLSVADIWGPGIEYSTEKLRDGVTNFQRPGTLAIP